VGQIAKDNAGAKGDVLAEYDFNGLSRMVRRVEDTGKYGNDTKLDLWHDTSGDYKGLDRFGRIMDMKFVDFSGSATDFARLKYTYDRNSNRMSIEDVGSKANSQSFTYDNLNRLTDAKRGILNSSNAVQKSDVVENFNMDLLGNFTSGAGGIKINGTTSTVTHAVNESNEITTLDVPNPAGGPKVINEPFTSSLSSFWIADKGTWSIASGQVNVGIGLGLGERHDCRLHAVHGEGGPPADERRCLGGGSILGHLQLQHQHGFGRGQERPLLRQDQRQVR